MNIPSIESLLAELDKVKAERDEWRKDCHAYADSLRRREDVILKLRAERDDLEKECQARSPLLMVLAVIREITGTQKQDGDATIAAVKKLVSEVDYWKTIRQENAEYFAKREAELIKERDEQQAYALARNAHLAEALSQIKDLKTTFEKRFKERNEEFALIEDQIHKLIKERDAALKDLREIAGHVQAIQTMHDASKANLYGQISTMKSALREAKEALTPYIKFVDGTQVKNHPAQVYDRINKVLGDE